MWFRLTCTLALDYTLNFRWFWPSLRALQLQVYVRIRLADAIL